MMEQIGQFIINHWILFTALLVIVALLLSDGLAQKMLGFKEVSPQEAARLINREDAAVLDVREEQDFKQGHIVNALSIPLVNLEGRTAELERFKNKPLIVSCQNGQFSARAATVLRKQGFQQVYKLAGGLLAWKDAKFPLSTR
ncbi:MAG: rhodanese-like domain-containing protein [Gammaproteobacteria bacterium]|nr:rhodanese-like domain-containing protein [Gammaproteobacteria bacterium]